MKNTTASRNPFLVIYTPIRITKNENTNFEAVNYDEWDICVAACHLGEEMKTPVFRFLKEALIRKYGEEFYEQLDDIYTSYFS